MDNSLDTLGNRNICVLPVVSIVQIDLCDGGIITL